MLGHKADLGFMALGPDLWRLRQLQTELAAADVAGVDSYVSLTEISEYAQGVPDELKESRLHPNLLPEGKSAFCFYSMSQRRDRKIVVSVKSVSVREHLGVRRLSKKQNMN